ncbi:hypothetical protein SADUNF_Sadunf11G0052700 [Salix dunnii]|uniref:Uncharacterized protein n=1 Tax=Salix dunnii TaxID=1413687 RepID=A0A835JQ79_9ROSI|nr:hypothetical protein SADUNF_Sadunf11G0052700 [Salix dunnii]
MARKVSAGFVSSGRPISNMKGLAMAPYRMKSFHHLLGFMVLGSEKVEREIPETALIAVAEETEAMEESWSGRGFGCSWRSGLGGLIGMRISSSSGS